MEYNSIHFLVADSPQNSFKREYLNDREAKISHDQSLQQSDILKKTKEAYDTTFHNYAQVEQASRPEEGIDKLDLPDSFHDPFKPNIKKLEREIRNELKVLHLERPNIAAKHLEFLTSKNTDVDYEFTQPPVPLD